MTDTITTAPAAGAAQPIADANPIDAIIDNAEIDNPPLNETTAEKPEAEEDDKTPWPKKANNALAHEKGKTAKWRESAKQERMERERLVAEVERLTKAAPQAPQTKAVNDGEPQEKDFTNYHDYIRALNKYDAGQLLAERDSKQKETQASQQEKAWVSEREQAVATSAQKFIKENPEAQAIIDEYGDVIDDFPASIQRILLEAGEDAPLAVFNLAKAGKLEEFGTLSPARAAIELGRALTQAVKPQTKAPTPLPASRGSVSSGKSLDSMSGEELLNWVNTKD